MVSQVPNTGNAALDKFLADLKKEVETAIKPDEGWRLSDFSADVSEVISDRRDLIDIVSNWNPELIPGNRDERRSEFAISDTNTTEVYLEVSALPPLTSAPPGLKPMVVAEVEGKPGVVTELWFALQSTDETRNSPMEDGGTIRIFLDDRVKPAVEMSIADFFGYSGRALEFNNPKIARTAHHGFRSGSYRNFWAPYKGYMRIELINKTTTEMLAYGSVSYRDGLQSEDLGFRIANVNNPNAVPLSEVTIADVKGNGQVESIFLAVSSSKEGDLTPLEGNFRVEIDGKSSSVSSGTEDFFRGSWYVVPTGGYPIGRAGNSTLPGSHISLYRFFPETAFRFKESLKVIFPVGQQGQGVMKASKYHVAGSVSYWLVDDLPTPKSIVPDYESPVVDYDFSGGKGGPAYLRWQKDPGKRAPLLTKDGVKLHAGTTEEPDVADQRLWLTDIVVPDDYWLEGEMIVNSAPVGADWGFIFDGGTELWPDPMFGEANHMSMDAVDNNGFRLRPRDRWDWPFVTTYPHGSPVGKRVNLAVRKLDGVITCYYKPPKQDFWTALCSWTPRGKGRTVGIYSWRAGVTFTRFALFPLKEI